MGTIKYYCVSYLYISESVLKMMKVLPMKMRKFLPVKDLKRNAMLKYKVPAQAQLLITSKVTVVFLKKLSKSVERQNPTINPINRNHVKR